MNDATDDSPDAVTIRRLRRVMAVFTGLLMAATWPLWSAASEFPQIPWLNWACRLPPGQGEVALVANLAVLLLLQFVEIRRTWLRRILNGYFFLASVPLLLIVDQHRLQPWTWQMLIGAGVITLSRAPRRSLRYMQWFTISIYFWSAVSKLDWGFIEGHGQLLVGGLAKAVGLPSQMWPESLRYTLAAAMSVGELVVASLLAFRSSWQIGLWSATLMHLALILALGPAGLGHEWGVLIWNAYFIVQVWLLFGRAARMATAASRPAREPRENPRLSPALVITAFACLSPTLSLVGWWDWWPSWAVYSSRPAIVQMLVQRADVERLPASLQAHVGPAQALSDWCPVNLDAWSFDTDWCPIYPQQRYRLAVISAVANRTGVEPRVVVHSTPNRWTGKRVEQVYSGAELTELLAEYWINIDPRRVR